MMSHDPAATDRSRKARIGGRRARACRHGRGAERYLAEDRAAGGGRGAGACRGWQLRCRGVAPVAWGAAYPQGLANLKSMGVIVVVNLRHDEDEVEGEQHVVEGLGMRYVAIPVSGMSTPTYEQVAEFLRLFVGQPRGTVFVHCRRGADRTGVIIAAYRIAFDGWATEQALDEMKEFHFAYLLYPNMVSYVRSFPRALKELPLFAFLRR